MALHASDAGHLEVLADTLDDLGVRCARIVEGEGQHCGQIMALGIEPVADRSKVRKVVSSLPLVR